MYQAQRDAQVRGLHTSIDAPAVDIYINGLPAITNLAFGRISNYTEVPAGNQRVQIYPAGLGAASGALIDTYTDVQGGKNYTLAAVGALAKIKPVLLPDAAPAPSPSQVKARFFHASPDAPAIDVAVKGGAVLFSNVPFGQASSFVDVTPGTVSLEFRPSGAQQSVLSIPDYSLDGGNLYTFVALGLINGQPAFYVTPIVDIIQVRVAS